MYKDMIISFLGALLMRNVLGPTDAGEQIAIIMGWATMLFIFCLFCEDQLEKMQKKQKRIREMEHRLEELKGGRADENRTVLHGQAAEDGRRLHEGGDPEGLVSGEVSV